MADIPSALQVRDIVALLASKGVALSPAELTAFARASGAMQPDGSIAVGILTDAIERMTGAGRPEVDYATHKERTRDRQAQQSKSGRDIGPLPPVRDPERRAECARSLRLYCETYHRSMFGLPWSDDHLEVISSLERVALKGGQYAMGLPRGFGKSSLCETGAEWALLNGHRRFVVPIGPSEDHAVKSLASIRTDLETNDLLLEDFPEVCYPIRRLEGINQRASGQLLDGRPTRVSIRDNELRLPTIPGSQSSGSIIMVAGITSSFRGMKHKLADGRVIRPDLLLIDDPQTDESARSPSQCMYREEIVTKTAMGLAGPTEKIAALMTCTVVQGGDLADRFLDPDIYPDWQGKRGKTLYSLPENEELWARYAEILRECLKAKGEDGIERATRFYQEHRAEMDKGAKAAWEARFEKGEVSAIQYAMNKKILSPIAFAAEYQNEPATGLGEGLEQPDPNRIMHRINRRKRRQVPLEAQYVVAHIDIQATLLYFSQCAWTPAFGGGVIDYGCWPKQRVHYFVLREARHTIQDELPGASEDACIWNALTNLVGQIMTAELRRDDDTAMRVDLLGIDANWKTDLVYKFCRESEYANVLRPMHGRSISASSNPIRDWTKKPGDLVGEEWRYTAPRQGRVIRHVIYDGNYWKSQLHGRLAAPIGDASALTLYGDRPEHHRMFADHLCAETRVRTEGRGRTLDEWKHPPHKPDNHLLDSTTGCAVLASMLGCKLEQYEAQTRQRRKVKLSALRRRRSS